MADFEKKQNKIIGKANEKIVEAKDKMEEKVIKTVNKANEKTEKLKTKSWEFND